MEKTDALPKDLKAREKLLQSARRVFAQKGFDGATVKELADEAGLNVSLVSYYFGGKEGVYKTCIEEVGMDRLAMAERILKAPESYEDFRVRLTLFVEDFINFNLKEKDVCAILHRECLSGMEFTRDIFRNTYLKSTEKLRDFFRAAQKARILRREIDADILNYLFFGSLVSAVRFEPISKEFMGVTLEDPKFKEKVITHAVDHLIGGFLDSHRK